MKLTEAVRDDILSCLDEEQILFLREELRRGKRTVFANIIAEQKGLRVPEGATFEDIEYLVDSWILIGYIDAGRVTADLKCECGRSLRYQYHVLNKQTGQELKFGIDHLEMHTGIDAKTVSEIRSGFSRIDLELDEILLKIDAGWSIDKERLPPFSHIQLPQDIQRHLDIHVPLLDRQVVKLKRLINEHLILKLAEQRTDAPIKRKTKSLTNDLFSAIEEEGFEELTIDKKQAILTHLQNGVKSARILCELLIKDGVISDKRYLTGKPSLYVDVCWFIDSFVSTNQCEFISGDQSDRLYKWI